MWVLSSLRAKFSISEILVLKFSIRTEKKSYRNVIYFIQLLIIESINNN